MKEQGVHGCWRGRQILYLCHRGSVSAAAVPSFIPRVNSRPQSPPRWMDGNADMCPKERASSQKGKVKIEGQFENVYFFRFVEHLLSYEHSSCSKCIQLHFPPTLYLPLGDPVISVRAIKTTIKSLSVWFPVTVFQFGGQVELVCVEEGCVSISNATDKSQLEVKKKSRYILGEKWSKWNINCGNELVFILYPNTKNANTNKFTTSRSDGCIPPSSVKAGNVTFNRMTNNNLSCIYLRTAT